MTFSSISEGEENGLMWIYDPTKRHSCSCDKGGTWINANSGLMGDFIDSNTDDQNAVLTEILIGQEWKLITPDKEQYCHFVCLCVFPQVVDIISL